MPMDYTSLLLSKIEEIPRLGLKAQLKMAPPQRFGTKETLLAIPEDVRYAAIMMLLYPVESELHFCLIQRSTYDGQHSGQISFPGGKKEETDIDYWATAQRETQEEVGVDPSQVTFLKQLSPTYIPPSNFIVSPFVTKQSSYPNFKPDKREVQIHIELPLETLIKFEIEYNDINLSLNQFSMTKVPSYVFNNHIIWGATAMILFEFKNFLESHI